MTSSAALSGAPKEIDYRLRPAKNVERKMLVELMYRLGRVSPIETYSYVGMGSVYFADFSLFHRAFGITDMLSIEGRDQLVARCIYNRPFDCIDVQNIDVARALPNLNPEQPTILWLDYDGKLTHNILDEIRMAVSILAPGSLLLVSVNVHPDPVDERIAKFHERFGQDSRITKSSDLNRKKFPRLCHEYIDAAITSAARTRSAIDRIQYDQLIHFTYEDGALMLTVGGILYSPEQAATKDRWKFDELDFYAPGAEPFEIVVPKLTHRERVELDRLLPQGQIDDAPAEISNEDVEAYAKLYRQVPVFVDAVI